MKTGALFVNGHRAIVVIRAGRVLRVGRDPSNDVEIAGSGISAFHCCVWSVLGDCDIGPVHYIRDYSRNGSAVNGRPVGKNCVRVLEDGDVVEIGKCVSMRFVEVPGPWESANDSRAKNLGPWSIRNKRLGHGSYGSVYVAYNRDSPAKSAAVKVIRCSKRWKRARMLREAKLLRGLRHPNIISLLDTRTENKRIFLFHNLVCGGDLAAYMAADTRMEGLPEPEALFILFQLLHALQYLHEEVGIVHRDVKLDNILLDAPSAFSRVVLCDFGAAKRLKDRPSTRVGTIEYIAPEVLENDGRYDCKCDIWSLGISLTLMLTGLSGLSKHSSDSSDKRAPLRFKYTNWSKVSFPARHMVSQLLQHKTSSRPTAAQCFTYPWIKKYETELHKIYDKMLNSIAH